MIPGRKMFFFYLSMFDIQWENKCYSICQIVQNNCLPKLNSVILLNENRIRHDLSRKKPKCPFFETKSYKISDTKLVVLPSLNKCFFLKIFQFTKTHGFPLILKCFAWIFSYVYFSYCLVYICSAQKRPASAEFFSSRIDVI